MSEKELEHSRYEIHWWEKTFRHLGAIWTHDGHPRRPYALLTNPNKVNGKRRLSNVYFDGAKVVERPRKVLRYAAQDLVRKLPRDMLSQIDIVCGSPYGSITLASRMAEIIEDMRVGTAKPTCLAWHTEVPKKPDYEKQLALLRFAPPQSGLHALVVDDAFSTGGTSEETAKALERAGVVVLPHFLYLVNRMGVRTLHGREIISLYEFAEGSVKAWDEGENPFTPDGKELVPPVKPKECWEELNKVFE